ncbi:hypothetical protein [Mucilaginibacter sp. CSA2-8R]|uniref:hypothetical protein n=1 Tax=Mucilaginibacter sp. CSA2-8R TaxID=3141542 RepID=UPI00315D6D24
MNIEDKAPLVGNYNRTDLRLVVVDMAQNPTPDGNQARTIAASDLFAQLEQGREVIPFEALTSLTWNVLSQPRVYLELTADLLHITTKYVVDGYFFELHARQPQGGGKKLTIDGVPVLINRTGNTLILARYIAGVLDMHTDASADAGKPVLLDESVSQTVLDGEYAEVWAKFAGADDYTIERDGKPVPDATGAALLVKVAEQTAGAYEVIARNDYGETRSAAKFIKPGEAESVYLKTQPQPQTLPAGNNFELTAEFGGTPPPAVSCFEVVNGVRGAQVASGSTFTGSALYTKSYQFVGTNSYKVAVVVAPAVVDADGTTVITPAVTELQKKTFTAESAVVTVAPVKQNKAAPVVVMDDLSVSSTLNVTPASGEGSDLFEGTLDATAPNPVVIGLSNFKLMVGDVNLPSGLAGIRYRETLTHNASAWATNTLPFTGSLIAPPTGLVWLAEDPADKTKGKASWTKSVDTLNPSTQEYQLNGGPITDISENSLSVTNNISAGGLKVREKARSGKPASDWMINIEPFVTYLNALHPNNIEGKLNSVSEQYPTLYRNPTTPILLSDYKHIIELHEGGSVYYNDIFGANTFLDNTNVFLKEYNDNDSNDTIGGATKVLNSAGIVITDISYRIIRGIKNGGGVRGTNLRQYDQGASGVYWDVDSQIGLDQNGKTMTVETAYCGVTSSQDYVISNLNELDGGNDASGNPFKPRVFRLTPVSTNGITSNIVGGVWVIKN